MKVDNILTYSIELKKGEKVFIFAADLSKEYCNLLCDRIIDLGATPFILWNDFALNESLIKSKNDSIYSNMFELYEPMIDSCDSAIMLDNNLETYIQHGISSDDLMNFKNKYYLKVFKKIMNFEKWVYLRYSQKELADLYGLSYDEHIELLENVSNFNYESLKSASQSLKKLLDKTDNIHIFQGVTDVTFSKKGIPACVCCGNYNLPDGEVFTAPEKFSVNGKINFNIDGFFR